MRTFHYYTFRTFHDLSRPSILKKKTMMGIVTGLAILVAYGVGVAAEPLILSAPGTAAPALYASVEAPGAALAVETWRTFFADRGVEAQVLKVGAAPTFGSGGALLAFETEEMHPVASRMVLDLSELKDVRDEAYLLAVRFWEGRPLVLIVGKTAAGVAAGANYLLSKVSCEVGVDGWTVTCPPFEMVRQPFFRGREATLCPTGREFPEHPEVNYENWDTARLLRYPAYLKVCGFNSVQLMELVTYNATTKKWDGGYYGGLPRGKTIEDIQQVLYTLMDATHAQGMYVSQYIYGTSADGNKWADPKTRPSREEFYRELARRYGKKVDHIITHWKDPGNEGGYETPLTASMFIWREYQKQNPMVQVTCDAWWNPELYQGIADEKYATKDVGIATERWYNAKRAEQIIKAGRKVGVWGWYLGDFEMAYGSKLYTKTLDRYYATSPEKAGELIMNDLIESPGPGYYAALPEKAGEQVDWISSELCFHGLPSRLNLYVAGRKMWDPKVALPDLMLDYCRAMYGPANAEIMRMVYETVEEGQKEVRFGMVEKDRYPVVLGTANFQEKVEKVLNMLEGVQLSPDWKPNFAVVASPQEDIDHLRKSLEEFAQHSAK